MSVMRILIGMPIIHHITKKSTHSFSVCLDVISLTGDAGDRILHNSHFSRVLQQFSGFPEQSGPFFSFFLFWEGVDIF